MTPLDVNVRVHTRLAGSSLQPMSALGCTLHYDDRARGVTLKFVPLLLSAKTRMDERW